MIHSWQVIEAQSPIRIGPSLVGVGSSRQCMILERSQTFETKSFRDSEIQFYRHKYASSQGAISSHEIVS